MRKIRCAIYTRKSSEEGLDQAFNSLDAQREACAAYIASQKHEGWVLLPDHYDDGGISGGTLEREALIRLMSQVDEGLVDQIVVYKIDRLTRSLADFAKLVDRLDGAGASFVSVTQSFNTATSMGRLTLNVLLSFAQFEREVTAERIRDKIAASKRKGMWMGGNVPLGYEADGRTLRIREEEAATVRAIYDLYNTHGSITATTAEAQRLGLRSKVRASGRGGNPLGRGHIHAILTSPVYAGRIRHREQVHAGQHVAIIDADRWDAVQERLMGEARRTRGGTTDKGGTAINGSSGKARTRRGSVRSPLAGKLFDETGDVLTPSHANKRGRRYRYYVSNRLIAGTRSATATADGWRLPAAALEEQLARAVHRHIRSALLPKLIAAATIVETQALRSRVDEACVGSEMDANFLACIERADLRPGRIRIALDITGLGILPGGPDADLPEDAIAFDEPFTVRKRGVEARLVIGSAEPGKIDRILIDNLARAHACREALKQGRSLADVAADHGVSVGRTKQYMAMAFLAPDLVTGILRGDQPAGLTSEWLQRNALPEDWQEQRRLVATLR